MSVRAYLQQQQQQTIATATKMKLELLFEFVLLVLGLLTLERGDDAARLLVALHIGQVAAVLAQILDGAASLALHLLCHLAPARRTAGSSPASRTRMESRQRFVSRLLKKALVSFHM